MDAGISTPLFYGAAIVLGITGTAMVIAGLAALFRARAVRFTYRTLAGLLLIATGALAAAVAAGMQGYRALTREVVAARIIVHPAGPRLFHAEVHLPDGRRPAFEIAGDEMYVDAHILKWKPLANFVGLHTAYELDRIAGRYVSSEEERSAPRTVYSLGAEGQVDLFHLRRRYEFLSAFFDAEYGSASFIQVSGPAEFEVRVSTSGLLIRRVGQE